MELDTVIVGARPAGLAAAIRLKHLATRSHSLRWFCAAAHPGPPATPHADSDTLEPACDDDRIAYPKLDGVLTFDRLSFVFISNANHEKDQSVHLKLRDPSLYLGRNWEKFRSPESRYYPASVYEAWA